MEFSQILQISESSIEEKSRAFHTEDLPKLIGLLDDKDDKLRYRAFLLLQYRSQSLGDVYPYWDTFVKKLSDDNSYHRSIALMLLAENARWDNQNRMEAVIERYLEHIYDPKPITARQCIQALEKILPYKPNLHPLIASRLMETDLSRIRDTMRKLILSDILTILIPIRRASPDALIDQYIDRALVGGLLDSKTKKQIQSLLS